jgi:hypothetical protein
MEIKNFKVVDILPDNMTGHIIVFNEPLIVHKTKWIKVYETIRGQKIPMKQCIITGDKAECHFMRASGGFGSYKCCSGRMIIGYFFKTIDDVLSNKPYHKGNTKCYPDGFIPELFTKHEKL